MAFDQTTRNRLARFVGEARALLTEEFTRQFQHEYGLDPASGAVTILDRLTALDDARRETARILRETMDYYLAGKQSNANTHRDVLERIVREQAFTVLNRLCALRMAEGRGLLIESVGRGYQSKGFQLYARLAGPALGETGEAYRSYLYSVFDEFAVDLPVLFDRFSPQGRLFPREATLIKLLGMINDPEIEPLWAEDETIGWIYQYFNSKEERQKMRAESQAPRNSRELAVRNQFFTPRYVVEFLTDNTLGRIWYEMTKGETGLKDACRYLVRRPREIFLGNSHVSHEDAPAWVKDVLEKADFSVLPENPSIKEIGEFALLIEGYSVAERYRYGDALEFGSRWMQGYVERGEPFPKDALELWLILFAYQRGMLRHGVRGAEEAHDPYLQGIRAAYNALRQALQNPPEDLSQEELLRQPVYIPHRPLKDPREIKMLDPACGSMHFGLYAFDLFEEIYHEAWQRGLVPPEDFGYRPEAVFLHESVRLDLTLTPTSNYSGRQVPYEEAFVVITRQGDYGDGVTANNPYLVDSRIRFRVPFDYRVRLQDFDYQAALHSGLFDEKTGEEFVRHTGCFSFDEIPAVSLEQAYEDYRIKIPQLIIEHNIHGIDIDPRAVQIAGLSLWLRAQKSWQAQGVKPHERPQIRKSNIVCAEPMPGDREMLEEFLGTLKGERLEALMRQALPGGGQRRATPAMAEALAKLVRTVWQEMELAGEAGSLLKIEETMREAVAVARRESEEKAPLFRVLEYGMQVAPGEASAGGDFWAQAEALVLAALQAYAEQVVDQVANGLGYRRRLFAEDAVQGFAFIDICRKRYDFVVMNPPFGWGTPTSKSYQDSNYPNSKNDIYCAFVEQMLIRLNYRGLLGSITSRTAFFLTSMYLWRQNVLLKDAIVTVFADLGFGVLDNAFVETAGFIVSKNPNKHSKMTFYRLNEVEVESKENTLLLDIGKNNFKELRIEDIQILPGLPFSYWISQKVRNLFKNLETLHELGGIPAVGLATSDNNRFLRTRWEVQPGNSRWKIYTKGGGYSPFYQDIPLVVDWYRDGAAIKSQVARLYGSASRFVQNTDYYGKPGLTYPRVTVKGFSAKTLPAGSIFSDVGQGLFSESLDLWALLGILNTKLAETLMRALTPSRMWNAGFLKLIPLPKLSKAETSNIRDVTKHLQKIKAEPDKYIETSAVFCNLSANDIPSIQQWYDVEIMQLSIKTKTYGRKFSLLENMVLNKYGIEAKDLVFPKGDWGEIQVEDDADIPIIISQEELCSRLISYQFGSTFGRWDIRFATGERTVPELPDPFAPLPACPPGMLQNAQGLPAAPEDMAADYPLRISWGGILVDDVSHLEDVDSRVREALQVIWCERAEAIEAEACQLLGVHSLREYFRKPGLFFADHLKRYSKSRRQAPIYWPLSTPSCSYTLWLYYHRLSDQTLFTCVNDFVDPKLKQVSEDAARLRLKKDRGAADEKELERLTDFERELKDFRAELLRVAAFWKPNLNDGVQITAAPLWKLFQHKPWQKKLKETWEKLEAGEYDWAHLAYSIWPERVREKCKTDKSLAIAHELEHLYVEPKAPLKKKKGKKQAEMELEDLFDED